MSHIITLSLHLFCQSCEICSIIRGTILLFYTEIVLLLNYLPQIFRCHLFFSFLFFTFALSPYSLALSVGLMADAANSAGDLLIDAVVFYTIKEARKKATPERPWGRGKIEPLGALTIGGVLLATGGGN